ncbi:MAG TPA: Smr/MutS family protein [Selenomonadales bacterium]|nr:Smr/MutS family protein [Selenomonadales bacterium]
MATKMIIINLEHGMPTVEQANRRLAGELIRARAQGAKVVKIIHGYGSSGVGGKLKIGVQAALSDRKKRGEIREAVPGEYWSIFDERARRVLEAHPDLNRDRDFERGNAGITIILL